MNIGVHNIEILGIKPSDIMLQEQLLKVSRVLTTYGHDLEHVELRDVQFFGFAVRRNGYWYLTEVLGEQGDQRYGPVCTRRGRMRRN